MSKTYVIFLANGQSFDVHNVASIGYTGAEGHQKNMMLSDPDGNILGILSENHCGLLYKGPTNPEDVPRFPVDATAPAPEPQPAQAPTLQTPFGDLPVMPNNESEQLHREMHANNAMIAKGYLDGYTRGEQDRDRGYHPQAPHPYPGEDQYWQRQGWGDGYHQRGFHVPGR